MENIEIYTSKKKSILLLLGSLIFVGLGIWFTLEANDLATSMNRNPILLQGVGIFAILFFGLGIYAGIKRLVSSQLMLIISPKGLNVDPKKSITGLIGWNEILGFDEISIHGTKILIINVKNPDSWLEKEKNQLRRQLMKYNIENYSSPFNISSNGLNIDHAQLKNKLTRYWEAFNATH